MPEMDDLLKRLDERVRTGGDAWWNDFFADRARACPFFVDRPDETLVADFKREVLRPGRALELGCGNGRNAIYLASRGCSVDAVDFSEAAITWAMERTRTAGQAVRYTCASIFELEVAPATYDIVYDSGCFHHVPPHRRESYLKLVSSALKPGGALSLICFGPEDGSGLTDMQVYERRTLGGGLGYSEARLRTIFEPRFTIVEMRRMHEMLPSDESFGKDFLCAVRMIRNCSGRPGEK